MDLQLREHRDPKAFLAAAAPVLDADEARHNLGFGICSTLIASPETYPDFHLWTVEDRGAVVGVALQTPPHNIWLAQPGDDAAVEFLARELDARGHDLPGITAALPEVEQFVEEWERLRGAKRLLRHAQGIYRVSAVRRPDVRGRLRDATAADRPLLLEWWGGFVAEALQDSGPDTDVAEAVDRRLSGNAGGIVIWDDGRPVSFAAYGGDTPNGARIGPVYTPPEHRRRGYGSVLTADLSQQLLDDGRSYCFLYTDLANPTSNRIYGAIGYERVCESAMYEFG